jgi:hypothetical protein
MKRSAAGCASPEWDGIASPNPSECPRPCDSTRNVRAPIQLQKKKKSEIVKPETAGGRLASNVVGSCVQFPRIVAVEDACLGQEELAKRTSSDPDSRRAAAKKYRLKIKEELESLRAEVATLRVEKKALEATLERVMERAESAAALRAANTNMLSQIAYLQKTLDTIVEKLEPSHGAALGKTEAGLSVAAFGLPTPFGNNPLGADFACCLTDDVLDESHSMPAAGSGSLQDVLDVFSGPDALV